MKPNSDRIKEIFSLALQTKPPAEREQYLAEACRGQQELRQQVESLLQAHEQAGAFLDKTVQLTSSNFVAERAGTMIGRYKLLQQIGEGGCGVVYMAEQQEPVRRRVALKVIKLGMDTRQVIARFEAERQALALMDHPNIAKVLDAGVTETGRPFFVMELVKGIPITRYCDENNLSTETRLSLFVQVCQAIQHAHQKGIIHRDIKPSNVLVADHDGVPVPKIIDFGIAKATTDQRLTDKTLFTAFEQFIGTPAYMSPEQAKLSGLDIDTRSDIYSLGVLLYELLTGKTPFEASRLLEAGLDEIRRIIREEEPPRPSTRLHTLDAAEQTTVAKHRQSDPPKLVHLIRGDLDWIVMKTLEKERGRRYETASALAMDVQRYLSHEAIVARPPSNLYRMGKLLRRNRRTLITATAIVVLVVATSILAWPRIQEQVKARLAKAALAKLVWQPPPWQDGEEMRLDATIAGAKVGTSRYTVRAGQTNGLRIWRLIKASPAGLLSHSLVEAQAETFKPIHSRYEMGDETVVDTAYGSDAAEVRSSGHAESRKVGLDGRVFDNEEFYQLVRCLPLKPGYKIGLPLLAPGGAISKWEVEVSGVETVTVPAGTFQCFKLKPFAGQTYWYSTDPHHYLVKVEQGGYLEELSGVRQSTEIVLQSPPWRDGEELQLEVKISGSSAGRVRYTVKAGQTNGLNIWRLMKGAPDGHTLVEAQAGNLKPVYSRYELADDRVWQTAYHLDHAEIEHSGQAKTSKVTLDGLVFDNVEFFELARCLPLRPGYKIGLPLMTLPGSIYIGEVEVSGVETVSVPAGTFECFKLKPFAGQTYWYSTDSHRYPVKFEMENYVQELASVQSTEITLQPPPWRDGEEMQLEVKVAGAVVATNLHAVSAGKTNGLSLWHLVQDFTGNVHTRSFVDAQADNFVPIHSHCEMPHGQTVDISYGTDHAEVKSSGKAEMREVALDGRLFDNEEFFQLVRRLPLESGYKIGLPVLTRGGVMLIWEIEVSGVETLTVPAGTFQCFKLKPFHGQTYWYSTDPHRYLVEVKSGQMVEELSAVRQRAPGE